jgi:diguanylate cyclase (GGDEF)-like protein
MILNTESFAAWSQRRESIPGADIVDLFTARPRAAADPFGFDDAIALARTAVLPAPGIPFDDWDILAAAVEARLGLIVGAQRMDPAAGVAAGLLRGIRADVLECVRALAQLRTALAPERARAEDLERALSEAQAAAAKLRTELAGTRAAEREASHRALHDSLTSLPNRAAFGARLAQAISHADPASQSLAVMYIDLDGFKHINDTHGHAIGDEMLRIVAARLTRAMRADDVVGRLGGDEFAALLSVVPPCAGRLERLARELTEIVAEPFQLGTLSLTVRPSIGIAAWPGDGATVEALLCHADAAMYRAKRARSGHAFFDGHDGAVVGPTAHSQPAPA